MAAHPRYLPLGILEDEGPGFQLAVIRLSAAWVQRVMILGALPSEGGQQ
jgi:hypothetical protein